MITTKFRTWLSSEDRKREEDVVEEEDTESFNCTGKHLFLKLDGGYTGVYCSLFVYLNYFV